MTNTQKNSRILKFNVIDRSSSNMQGKDEFDNKFLQWQPLKTPDKLLTLFIPARATKLFPATFKAKPLKTPRHYQMSVSNLHKNSTSYLR